LSQLEPVPRGAPPSVIEKLPTFTFSPSNNNNANATSGNDGRAEGESSDGESEGITRYARAASSFPPR